MNYYRRFMGDYAGKTADLSLTEHGAYNVLLDTCYTTEKPLPAAYEALYRLCRAMNKLEQAAVRSVADRFFPIGKDDLRHNPRADEEIAKAQATIAKQRDSGVDSAAKRWSTDRSTHKSTDPAAIQPPTSNLQPLTPNPQPPASKKKRNGDAASPPDPAKEEIWLQGRALLEKQGESRENAGGFIGKLCKDYGQVLVLEAVRDAVKNSPAEPKAWLVARCQERRVNGKTPWWSSDASILAEGQKLGKEPRPGESMQQFKGRVEAAISGVST